MKTPSKYPVLDNKPIDQWKVTELKEELKRRKLITKGLKEDLIKRLDEALRTEREAEEEANNGVNDPEPEIVNEVAKAKEAAIETSEAGTVAPVNAEETMGGDDGKRSKVDIMDSAEQASQDKSLEEKESEQPSQDIKDSAVQPSQDIKDSAVQPSQDITYSAEQPIQDSKDSAEQPSQEIKDRAEQPSQDKIIEEKESELISDQPSGVDLLSATDLPSTGAGGKDCEGLLPETAMGGQGLSDDKIERDNVDSRAQQDSEDIKPPHEDVKLDTSDPNNQVSEVSTNLGFPIKSNSISSDSVSINEKNELEDNIIADNVKLEPDLKPEMVQPSSSDLVHDGGESHPKDVEEPQENKVSVEETDNNVTNADMSQKNHSADLGSSEKLNLDRSSGDDSMEEDALESKQIDSNYNSGEVGELTEKSVVTTMKEEEPFVAMDTDISAEEKSSHFENKDVVAASSDKRKLPEQEAVLNHDTSKRQRRWKSESNNKVREPQISNIPPAAAKDVPESAVLKRNLSRSDSVANDTPKEREVPPSAKAATNSLRIDRFLRPFTLKAVQELLAKTGSVTSFWMDHIKTHCYVTYSTLEEAVETRNAVYNLQWPPNGGRHLLAEFVDPEEVKSRVEAPSQPPAAPVSTGSATAPEPSPTLPQPSPRQQNLKQQMSQKPTLPPPPPLSNPPSVREWAHPPPPPPLQEKVEAPIMTLDDLFRKTKATPRIYYLPLPEEKVNAILEARRKNSRQ